MNVTEEFDVIPFISLANEQNLIINDIYHSYKQVNLNVYSLEGVLRDVNLYSFSYIQLDSYCLQEETICNCFGLNHLCKQMQDSMLQCIFASKVSRNLIMLTNRLKNSLTYIFLLSFQMIFLPWNVSIYILLDQNMVLRRWHQN